MRVAGAQDAVVAEIDVELLLEGCPYVDLGEYSEALPF
jgi:hypothetical protein